MGGETFDNEAGGTGKRPVREAGRGEAGPRVRVPELLAPAGSPDAFRAALAGGADAIYCALGSSFNARRGADNFTDEQFAAACREAHLAGARVYATLNVAIKDDELPRALRLARRAWELGADALIVQDWGLFARLREREPQIELHVSTQANVHDARGVAWCGRLGATRVTVSRELSLPELAACAATGVDVECFCHGAICVCYSGLCLMSSLRGGRSANRGLCAQPCRLPFELVGEDGQALPTAGERLLCPRDLCYAGHLGELARAGVASLKVEGRMKAPDYVLSVTDAYRRALDALAAGETPTAEEGDGPAEGRAVAADEDEALRRQLKRAFNRDFTDAYLRGSSDEQMMSYERSNNRGEVVGAVVGAERLPDQLVRGGSKGDRLRRHRRARLAVALTAPVGAGDLLEVRPSGDPSQFFTCTAPEDAAVGETVEVVGVRVAPAGSVVRVIRSKAAFDRADAALAATYVRRRLVRARVVARLGEPLRVEVETTDGGAHAEATGPVVEAARTRAVTADELAGHVARMGGTPFEAASVAAELDDGVGLRFSDVHAVRARAMNALAEEVLAPWAGRAGQHAPRRAASAVGASARAGGQATQPAPAGGRPQRPDPEVCALVTSPAAARAALVAGATRLYATADDLAAAEDAGQAWPCAVVPWLDEVCREGDHARLDRWVRPGAPVAVGNVSELALAVARGAAAEVRDCVPVLNHATVDALAQAGAAGVWLSPELTLEELVALAPRSSVPLGLVVWGRARLMTCEHCVLASTGRCAHDCARCALRRRRLRLRNIDGQLLPVRTDAEGRCRIYAAAPLDATPEVPRLVEAGVSRLLVDCTLLAPSEVLSPVRRAARALVAARAGRVPAAREEGATTGHLFAPIG